MGVMSTRDLEYTVLDVFAERPLEGNPLAVFHDARGLSTEQMQAIARETNLSETTFVLPGDDAERERREGVRVRIFTTQEELPFAGHPTLGTATWLKLYYPPLQAAETVTLKLNVGPIPVRFAAQEDGAGLVGTMRQNDPEFRERYTAEEVAPVLGLRAGDLLPGHPPQVVSTGNPFCIVALKDVATLERLQVPQRESTSWLRQRRIRWFYCIAPVEAGPDQPVWRARMQWEAGEDPATGSAAGPCIAFLVSQGLVGAGVQAVLHQGIEMKRPSKLFVRASQSANNVHDVEVAGRTIPVATGHFFGVLP